MGDVGDLAGLRIVVSHILPQECVVVAKRLPAHPLIQWLARYLMIDPWVEIQAPQWRDKGLWIDRQHGLISCSPAQADALRRGGFEG